jgi:hypothetical protein
MTEHPTFDWPHQVVGAMAHDADSCPSCRAARDFIKRGSTPRIPRWLEALAMFGALSIVVDAVVIWYVTHG